MPAASQKGWAITYGDVPFDKRWLISMPQKMYADLQTLAKLRHSSVAEVIRVAATDVLATDPIVRGAGLLHGRVRGAIEPSIDDIVAKAKPSETERKKQRRLARFP